MSEENKCFCQGGWTCTKCRDDMEGKILKYEKALRTIADQDYRGNRSVESFIAFDALKPSG